jgi:hypothetical protein
MVTDREQELGRLVIKRKEELKEALTPSEQKTTRRLGSAYPDTFEEKATFLAQEGHPRAQWVAPRLKAFQEAVNALWVYEIEQRLPERLVKTWRQKHRGYSWIAQEDLEAEVIFLMRHFIVRWDPDVAQAAQLFNYAYRGVHQALTEWAANQGPVELPRGEKRELNPEVYRRGISTGATTKEAAGQRPRSGPIAVESRLAGVALPGDEASQLACDPWSTINQYLDGEIDPEEL